MTRADRKAYYTARREEIDALLSALRRRSRGFLVGQIVSFAAVIAFLAAYTALDNGAPMLYFTALSAVLYVFIRIQDGINTERIDNTKALLTVVERELKYLEGDFSCFADGAQYVDPQHLFTFDIDIFGRESLFNRIDRTATTGGSDRLAEWLSEQNDGSDKDALHRIKARAEASKLLAEMPEWRTRLTALGANGKTDTHTVTAAIVGVQGLSVPSWFSSSVALAVAALSLAGFWAALVLSVFSDLPSVVPVMWGVSQFFIVYSVCSNPLKKIGERVGTLQDKVRKYSLMLENIGKLRPSAANAESEGVGIGRSEWIDGKLSELNGAQESFRQMSEMLKSIDRRGNLLGLIFSDALFLSDLFLVRKFRNWQRDNLSRLPHWIDIVSDIDALVSMATFRFNEPEATDAELTDSREVVFEARSLWHPFLGMGAVSNDFSIKDRNFYIVTGANMAGKSTFLRSIGINYVLAMNGLPVFAEHLRLSIFALFTSMRTTDDLTRGISYFNAELLRLRQLIAVCSRQSRTLIILDEILKGTNSADKLKGSRLFLEYISQKAVTGVVATHDLALSEMAEERPDRFHNYCFEIELGTDVTYTYTISQGVARNQNATFLLKELLKST